MLLPEGVTSEAGVPETVCRLPVTGLLTPSITGPRKLQSWPRIVTFGFLKAGQRFVRDQAIFRREPGDRMVFLAAKTPIAGRAFAHTFQDNSTHGESPCRQSMAQS